MSTRQYTDEQIFERVQSVIAETLRISLEEVKMDSVLGDELGATSLDFVDIIFRLQSDFKISFYEGGIIEKLSEIFGADALSVNGRLTELGAEIVRLRMPEVEASKINPGMPLAGIEALFTTATWVRVVKDLLDARPQKCINCASEKLQPIRPSVLLCEACKNEIPCPSQEQLLTEWANKISKSFVNA